MFKLECINNEFRLPISYCKDKMELNDNIKKDLELVESVDPSANSIYFHVFQPTNLLGKTINKEIPKHYTTNKTFLTETQTVLKHHVPINEQPGFTDQQIHNYSDSELDNITKIWEEIKNDTGFKEKYMYMDWDFLLFLNKHDWFLQIMSLYNLSSPVLSLLFPIFILIVPFFIIKIRGLKLSMNEYVEILKVIISNHAIGKVFTQFNSVDNSQKVYLLVSAAFYVFSIYQNILVCIRFYNNMKKIHNYMFEIKRYLDYSIFSMTRFIENYGTLTTYQGFIENMKNSLYIMQDLKGHLEKITEFKVSFNKITEIGFIMKHFYDLYEDPTYNKVFLYSFGFHGYMNNLDGLKKNIDEQHISYATFDKNTNKTADESKFKSKTKAETKFKKAYYPALISKNPVKNDYKLEKNLIITGPNASGKTTVLKSAIINLVLSQQWGCGCYETANIKPFKYIHCYLNIPDTSGRDSLFQAEARRCKEIIDCVNQNKEDSHFAVFDELYSGTNPEEAVISARAFMEYLVKNENVKCILTTHYIKLCKQLGKTKTIKNYNMKTIKKNDNFEYTYSLIEGISKTKGGLKVLTDMNYPKEIIDQTNELMK